MKKKKQKQKQAQATLLKKVIDSIPIIGADSKAKKAKERAEILKKKQELAEAEARAYQKRFRESSIRTMERLPYEYSGYKFPTSGICFSGISPLKYEEPNIQTTKKVEHEEMRKTFPSDK